MKQQLLPIPAKHAYTIPEWVANVPDTVFPQGPKKLYCYLTVFGRTGCWQYNSRLAKKYHTTPRTIQRWLDWLKHRKLIRIEQPYNRRRRIFAYPCEDILEFFTKPMFEEPKPAKRSRPLSKAEFHDRRQRMLAELCGPYGLPSLPPICPPPPIPCG